MQRASEQLVEGLRVAADRESLFLRLEGLELVRQLRGSAVKLAVLPDRPHATRVELDRWAAEDVVTVRVPFADLGGGPGEPVSLWIQVTDPAGQLIEQHPAAQPVVIAVPTESLWIV
jgi:hypothetical protein